MDHPFSFQSFKINAQDEVAALRGLGLKRIRYSPDKSDCKPSAEVPAIADLAAVFEPAEASHSRGDNPAYEAKQTRIGRLTAQQEKIAACKREFVNTTRQMKAVRENLFSRPDEVCDLAIEAVARLADSMLVDAEVAIHLISDNVAGDNIFNHSLNVALLSMMVGKEMKLSAEEIRFLGLGALLHDLGQAEIPAEIKNKIEPLTRSELALMQRHCALGVSLGRRLRLPAEALLVIAQHHEHIDGSGYPKKLSGSQLSPLSRIVAVIEAYDELCNPKNPSRALTPHEALATIYAQRQRQFDEATVTSFVRCLTVYPPGTIALLSNGALGEVVAVNNAQLRRPTVIVYDTVASNNDAILVDLELEPEVEITKAIKPQQLSPELGQFILARKRMSYGANLEAEVG